MVEQLKEEIRNKSSKDSGLFATLLDSNVDSMYYDSLDAPEKYTEQIRELLQKIVAEGRQPTSSERKLLDSAVIDFARKPSARTNITATTNKSETPVQAQSHPTLTESVPSFWWENR